MTTLDVDSSAVVSARRRMYAMTGEFGSEVRAAERRFVRQQDPTKRWAQQFEMREVPNGTGGTALRLTGYASVVERPYEMSDLYGAYQEEVARGAFAKTLRDRADVALLVNHSGVSLARTKPGTMTLSADQTGLHVDARLNLDRPDVRIVRAAVADKDLDEWSFAFRVTRQAWDEDYTRRRIQEVNMHQGDVSICNYAASPWTAAVAMSTMNARRKGSPSTITHTVVPNHAATARAALKRYRRRMILDTRP